MNVLAFATQSNSQIAQNAMKVQITPTQILLNLVLACALAYLWSTVYRKTHSGVAYSRSFFLTLNLVAPIIAMVMMAIGSNVALSLGLVGSLSVIRFRTVIKDSKDMAFLFFAIGLGLCCGAETHLVAIIGSVLMSILVLVLSKVGFDGAASSDYILVFRSATKSPLESLPAETQQMLAWKQLRSASDSNGAGEVEYTYNVRMAGQASPDRLVGALSEKGGLSQVTLIAPENHLDV
jgi:uncharacterized membrane protein YhiD involved in acid resistance